MSGVNGIQLRGVNNLIRRLQQYPENVQLEAKQEVQAAALDIVGTMVQSAPVDTGNLRQLIVSEPGANDYQWKIHSKAHYSAYVENGTRSHIIRAINKKGLSNGEKYFGPVVNHPGTAPKPFFWDNLNRGVVKLKRNLQIMLQSVGNR